MMLSGIDIKRAIERGDRLNGEAPRHTGDADHDPVILIDPFQESRLNPNSYNLTLHKHLKVYDITDNRMLIRKHLRKIRDMKAEHAAESFLDARKATPTVDIEIPEGGLVLEPGTLYLARTVEHTEAWNCVPAIAGRSSTGRLGLSIHETAGFGDVGFCGTWTMEMVVTHPVRVYAGMEVCQICYHMVSEDHENYKGRYLGQTDPTASRLHQGDKSSDE